jgi:LysM repeat protein
MTYGIELSFNNKQEVIQLPVVPSAIEISDSGKSKTYDVQDLGEINVIKDPKLPEYTFSSIFPAHKYPFVSVDPLPPMDYVKYILKWHTTKRPIRFIFVGDTFGINTPASIEKFDWREKAGSGDIEYTLKLKHYRFYAAQKVVIQQQSQDGQPVATKEAPERPNDRQPPATYTLAAGDTLWSVAKRFLDDGARWPEIQRLNNISDAEIKRLPVGKVLKLPQEGSGGRAYA